LEEFVAPGRRQRAEAGYCILAALDDHPFYPGEQGKPRSALTTAPQMPLCDESLCWG
jgi:hypothetical protein